MSEALAHLFGDYVIQQGLRESDLRRFLAKIDTSGGPESCHPWTGYRMAGGYGLWFVARRPPFARRTYRTHRLRLILENGPLGSAMALHQCDNPPCCNPTHLYAGTAADNAADVVTRQRHWTTTRPETVPRGPEHWTHRRGAMSLARGEHHGNAVLTAREVAQIRHRYGTAGATHASLAREFGVSKPLIGRIVRREVWAHVG